MLIDASLVIEGHKMILKPEITVTSRVMLEENPARCGSAQKRSMIKWKRFSQDHAAWGIQETVTSREPLFPNTDSGIA